MKAVSRRSRHSAGRRVCPERAPHTDFSQLAARFRIPTAYQLREYVAAGGLISYGTRLDHLYRQATGYVGRVLSGIKPADLPVQEPTKFELVINLTMAKGARPHGASVAARPRRRGDRVSAEMPVPDWTRLLRCTECGERDADFVVSGARR